jgi:hypothetical protein
MSELIIVAIVLSYSPTRALTSEEIDTNMAGAISRTRARSRCSCDELAVDQTSEIAIASTFCSISR